MDHWISVCAITGFIIHFSLICRVNTQSYCNVDSTEPVILPIAALFPKSGWWPGGEALHVAANMALGDVNSRADILPGYQLKLVSNDTECIPKVGTKRLHQMLATGQPKVMLLGPSTSDVSEATAQVAYVWNVVQLSTVAVSPTLSNKNKYPWFFRVSGPELKLNPARLAMMAAFGWEKVAILYQSIEFLIAAKNQLEVGLKNDQKKILASVELWGKTSSALEEIKNTDARIIFTFLLRDAALDVFCEAHKQGLYGRKYVWILVAWYEDRWWEVQNPDLHDCSLKQMLQATEGLFTVGAFYLNPILEKGISNMTSEDFMLEYLNKSGGEVLFGSNYAPQTYDGVWVIALALNDTMQKLEQAGEGKCLSDFNYEDEEMSEMIKDSLQNLTMLGVKGYISFDSNGDPFGPLEIRRIIENKYHYMGTYHHNTKLISWVMDEFRIFDGRAPRDSTLVEPQLVFVTVWLYVGMCIIAGLGILLAMAFLVVNITYRKTRIIKMSAPNLNNLILLGCMMSYTTVFFQDIVQWSTVYFCKIYIFVKSIGFAMTFGALFAKTWRIHVIFANKTVIKKVIRDSTLISLVMVFVFVNVVLLIIWNVVDPLEAVPVFTGQETFYVNEDRVEKQQLSICESQHMAIFYGTLYAIDGLTLLFGVFLAWETRKVTIPELNDSKYIGICIYNMMVPMVVGTGIYHLLKKEVNSQYTLTSLCQIVAITLTQCIIFAPKILKLREATVVPSDDFQGIATSPKANGTLQTPDSGNNVASRVKQNGEDTKY